MELEGLLAKIAFNLVNSLLKQSFVTEVLEKQDHRHCYLWIHQLLERVMFSGQLICSISISLPVTQL